MPGLPMIPDGQTLRAVLPELWLVAGMAANLLIPFGVKKPNGTCAAATLLALGMATVSVTAMGSPVFRGMFECDGLAAAWKLVLLPFVMAVVALWIGGSGRVTRQGAGPEYFVLILGATLGMSVLASTRHLVTIFLSLALTSLPSYLLAGFRKGNRQSAEAALKYVLFGAVTSAVFAYGLSFYYGATGSMLVTTTSATSAAVAVAGLGVLVGLGFKASAVPFHAWCPDVFEAAPIEVTTFLSVTSKGAALVLLMRLLLATAGSPGLSAAGWILGSTGAVTTTVGNLAALRQVDVKRLLAYSSIAQSGYILMAMAVVGDELTRVVMLYLAVYAVMNLGAFAVTAVVLQTRGSVRVTDFNGLGRTAPAAAVAMALCLLSLIGVPPVAGLAGKLAVLRQLAGGGRVGGALIGVVVVNTVISAFYYFRLIRAMYFEPPVDGQKPAVFDWPAVAIGVACGTALVGMFIGIGGIVRLLPG